MKRLLLALLADVLIAALIVGGTWEFGYKRQSKGLKAAEAVTSGAAADVEVPVIPSGNDFEATLADVEAALEAGEDGVKQQQLTSSDGSYVYTEVKKDTEDWAVKFADKFSDTVISTDTTYKSPSLSIELTEKAYDSGVVDTTQGGTQKKYGSKISYVLADIYVSDISCFKTVFAMDTYGTGFSETVDSMSDRMKAVLAVNGDSYSNDRHQENGTIIRNGVVYRAQQTDADTLVLNWDGTMKIYDPGDVNIKQLINDGAYQSWVFGPGLLDENGKAKTDLNTWDYIRESHPRTAIGYYEPGHYCLLVADGRQESSRGMFLEEMASLFESLGCTAAYNLDGGLSTVMTFDGMEVSHPYKEARGTSDGIVIVEAEDGSDQ